MKTLESLKDSDPPNHNEKHYGASNSMVYCACRVIEVLVPIVADPKNKTHAEPVATSSKLRGNFVLEASSYES